MLIKRFESECLWRLLFCSSSVPPLGRLPNLTYVDRSGCWIWQPVSAPVKHRIPSLNQELSASADRQQHLCGNMAERQIA